MAPERNAHDRALPVLARRGGYIDRALIEKELLDEARLDPEFEAKFRQLQPSVRRFGFETLLHGTGAALLGMGWRIFTLGQKPRLHWMQQTWADSMYSRVWAPNGSVVVSSTEQLKPDDGRPVICLMVHPSTCGMIPGLKSVYSNLPGPWDWGIKRELLFSPMGFGLWMIGNAVLIDRQDGEKGRKAIQGMQLTEGTALIMCEGTRPRRTGFLKAQQVLAALYDGDIEMAACFQHTGLPRPGVYHLLKSNPDARVVLTICFDNIHNEGIVGSAKMVGNARTHVRFVELDNGSINMSSELEFRNWLNKLWRHINVYIEHARHNAAVVSSDDVFKRLWFPLSGNAEQAAVSRLVQRYLSE